MPKLLRNKNFYTFLISSLFFLVIFYTFSFFYVKGVRLHSLDFDLTVRIQDKIPRKYDTYLSVLSLVGSAEVISVILALMLFLRRKIGGIIVFGLFLFMHAVEAIGKTFLHHPPPPFEFHRYNINFLFPSSYVQPGNSYPSGHAMRISFLAIVVGFVIYSNRKIKPELKFFVYLAEVAIVAAMMVSRVSLGEHWTTDVVGGGLLGIAFAIFALVFL